MTTPDKIISLGLWVRNQALLVTRTLESIYSQVIPDGYELEVVATDDGSDDGTDLVLQQYPLTYLRLENKQYRNGVFAKNSTLRHIHGDIVIQQSADVIHADANMIKALVEALPGHRASFATVYNHHYEDGITDLCLQYSGPDNPRPFFFLGACYREDVCRVGGYDPDFGNVIYYDDNWHADCLINTCGVNPIFINERGLHQHHARPKHDTRRALFTYQHKREEAAWDHSKYISSGGSWPYIPGKSVHEIERGI
jgi:glycosyltransferase involved in cell wall biosynthesis